MQNRFSQIIIGTFLLFLVFVSGSFVNARGARNEPKRMYKSDLTVPNNVQADLDQRTAEGWKFVAMSQGSQDGATVLVLVFEKDGAQ